MMEIVELSSLAVTMNDKSVEVVLLLRLMPVWLVVSK